MKHTIAILSILLSIIIGCSQGLNPSTPSPVPPDLYNPENSGRTVWGIWRMEFDPATATARAVPVHAADFHVDVTHFITPPECTDCLELTTDEFSIPDGILDLEASLTNPTTFTGFDVRAIIRWQTGHIWLDNADDYTTLFDDGGTKTLNPFIACRRDGRARVPSVRNPLP